MMERFKRIGRTPGARLSARALAAAGIVAIGAVLAAGGTTAGKFSERYAKASSLLVDRGNSALDKTPDAAKSLYEQAIVANPQNAKAYSALGAYYGRQAKHDLAAKYFGIALDIDPDQLQALSGGGKADLGSGNLQSAEAKLLRLQRKCGTCAEYKALSDAVASYKAAKKTN